MSIEPEAEVYIQNLFNRAAVLTGEGKKIKHIVAEFESEGIPAEIATAIARSGADYTKGIVRGIGVRTMIKGIFIFGIGAVITFGSYRAALNRGGGIYFATYGFLIIGAWIIIKGLWRITTGRMN